MHLQYILHIHYGGAVRADGITSANTVGYSGTVANVPEPTSGLLMLVGLAGLALRRRRA